MGRPSSFTDEIAAEICMRIACGETLRGISADDKLPHHATIFRWLALNEKFREQYAQAKATQAEVLAEQILDIADDGTNDYIQTEDGAVFNHEHFQRSRLRVDSRKWLLSKLLPKKYGDRTALEHSGPGGSELRITVTGVDDKPET